MLPARKREEDTDELWLRTNYLYSVFLYIIVPKLIACKLFDNMSVTLCQIYVQTEERKFIRKDLGYSDDFTKLLITFFHKNLRAKSLCLLLAGPSVFHFLSSCADSLV